MKVGMRAWGKMEVAGGGARGGMWKVPNPPQAPTEGNESWLGQMAMKIHLWKKEGTGFTEVCKCQLGDEGIQGHWVLL